MSGCCALVRIGRRTINMLELALKDRHETECAQRLRTNGRRCAWLREHRQAGCGGERPG